MSLHTVDTRDDVEERAPCTQQESSLGISKALKATPGYHPATKRKNSLRDDTFREASESDNLFIWARFYISLYFNKIAIGMFGCVTGWEWYNWYNRVDRYVFLGALPTPTHIKQLHSKERICAVVNLCAEFPGYKNLYDELGIKQTLLPTSDFTIPHLDSIEQGVEDILDTIEQHKEGTVYLHCKAGRGRSAVIAICYLLRMYLLRPSEAQDILLKCRPQVDKDLFQTDEVRTYYKSLISQAESGKITRIPCSFE